MGVKVEAVLILNLCRIANSRAAPYYPQTNQNKDSLGTKVPQLCLHHAFRQMRNAVRGYLCATREGVVVK